MAIAETNNMLDIINNKNSLKSNKIQACLNLCLYQTRLKICQKMY